MKIPKLLSLLMSAVLLFTGCYGIENPPEDMQDPAVYSEPDETFDVTVDFLKLGKADAAVIITKEHVVVIDCGETGDGAKVCRCLEALGRDKVDYLIITHYDKDHVGGAAEVVDRLAVEHVMGPNYRKEDNEYLNLERAMKSKGLKWEQPVGANYSFYLDDVMFDIYPPKQRFYPDGNDNNHSLVIKMIHHSEVFLFAGDAMEERLDELTGIGDCDVLKEPYHGREIKNLGGFLDRVKPEYAVVSTSEKYYSPVTDRLLSEHGTETFLTFRDGNIRCTSSGSSVSFEKNVKYG